MVPAAAASSSTVTDPQYRAGIGSCARAAAGMANSKDDSCKEGQNLEFGHVL